MLNSFSQTFERPEKYHLISEADEQVYPSNIIHVFYFMEGTGQLNALQQSCYPNKILNRLAPAPNSVQLSAVTGVRHKDFTIRNSHFAIDNVACCFTAPGRTS